GLAQGATQRTVERISTLRQNCGQYGSSSGILLLRLGSVVEQPGLGLSSPELLIFDNYFPLELLVAAVVAGVAGFSRTKIGRRGKENVPPASSMTFTWQVYSPGLSWASGTSN